MALEHAIPVVSVDISRHSDSLRTRGIQREKTTNGAATEGPRLTIQKHVVTRRPQKP